MRAAFVTTLLGLATLLPAPAKADGEILLGVVGGVIVPDNTFADLYGVGGMGAAYVGIANETFGLRVLGGSSVPPSKDRANEEESARQGRDLEVSLSVVPVELQVFARFPSASSRWSFVPQAGLGRSFVSLRESGTEHVLHHENHWSWSLGGGLRYRLQSRPVALTLQGVSHGFYDGGDATTYVTLELGAELML